MTRKNSAEVIEPSESVRYSAVMPVPEDVSPRKKNGRTVALAIMLICGLGAAFTVLNYSTQALSTADAKLLFEGKVIATMKTAEATKILRGMPATVTVDGYGEHNFPAVVDMITPDPDSAADTLIMLTLVSPPKDAKPPVNCQVTVDTSVPPELVKVRPKN